MPEPIINWARPTTPPPGDPKPIRGARDAVRHMVLYMPRDGKWYECHHPFSATSNNVQQAKRQFELEYPSFEFATFKQNGLRWMRARYRIEEE